MQSLTNMSRSDSPIEAAQVIYMSHRHIFHTSTKTFFYLQSCHTALRNGNRGTTGRAQETTPTLHVRVISVTRRIVILLGDVTICHFLFSLTPFFLLTLSISLTFGDAGFRFRLALTFSLSIMTLTLTLIDIGQQGGEAGHAESVKAGQNFGAAASVRLQTQAAGVLEILLALA
jgi:hypothetical protein